MTWPTILTGLIALIGSAGIGGLLKTLLDHKRAKRSQTDEVALAMVERLAVRVDVLEGEVKEARRETAECERRSAEADRQRAQDYSKLSMAMGWLGLSLNEIERIDPKNGLPLQIRTALNLAFPVDPNIPASMIERLPT